MFGCRIFWKILEVVKNTILFPHGFFYKKTYIHTCIKIGVMCNVTIIMLIQKSFHIVSEVLATVVTFLGDMMRSVEDLRPNSDAW